MSEAETEQQPRESPWTIHRVPAMRLAWGSFDHNQDRQVGEGDIYASYSGDKIALEGRVRKPFRFGADLWINTGMSGFCGTWETEAYRLVKREMFSGIPTSYRDKTGTADGAESARNDPQGFYHGMVVTCGKEVCVLSGPPAIFVADPERPIEDKSEPAQLSLF